MRLRSLFRKPALERDLDEELKYHLDCETERLVRDGMTPEEARHGALRAFGGVEQTKEQIRDSRGTRWLEEILQDVMYGARLLKKKPAFSIVAVLMLTLGIGANTAIFSVINDLLIKPPAGIDHPEQLSMVTWDNTGLGPSYPDYLDYRDASETLAGLATFSSVILHLSIGSDAERIQGALVSGNYFDVLGVAAARGRVLTPDDDTAAGANAVAIISDGLWKRLGSDPGIVGRTLRLNATTYTVVGVAPAEFHGIETGRRPDVWLPLSMAAQAEPAVTTSRTTRVARGWLRTFARLKSGAALSEAQAELSGIARSLEESHPETNKGVGIRLISRPGLGPRERSDAMNFTGMLAVVTGLVLLIACANVANLLLARGHERRKEIGTRLALGASRSRVIRQLLTESILLAVLGGALGVCLAVWLERPLRALISIGDIDLQSLDANPDIRVLGISFLIAISTGILFGIVPAIHAARAEITHVMKPPVAGHARISVNVKGLLVIAQVALSLVILVAAGLLLRTLQKAQSVQPGFNAEHVLMARVDAGRQGYSEAQGRQLYRQLIDRIQAVPGVREASIAHVIPLKDPTWRTRVQSASLPIESEHVGVDYNIVGPGYFTAMGIPFVAGRDFDRHPASTDENGDSSVAILNETLSRRLFPNEDPIGKQMIRFSGGKPRYRLEVIGIVKDSKYRELTEPPTAQMYLPSFHQYRPAMTLLVRSDGHPIDLIDGIRREVQIVDPSTKLFETQVLSNLVRASLDPQRSAVTLIGTFGMLGLVLAGLGLYGVMAFLVSQNTREIGIRIALGAERSDVIGLVLKNAAFLVVSGIGTGLMGAFLLTGLLKKLLFDVSTTDWITFISVPLLLSAIALLAAWIPARRATRVDPIVALRCE